jgi:DNA-binding MarR family transcriptional regulator
MKIEKEIKQNKFPDEQTKLEINFWVTASCVQYRSRQFYKQFDLSPQQYNVLRILRGARPNMVTLGYITERMIDKMSNATRLIDKLERKNLVSRVPNPVDRRQSDICINEEGLGLLAKIDKLLDIEIVEKYKNLTEKELKLLNSLLDKLRE